MSYGKRLYICIFFSDETANSDRLVIAEFPVSVLQKKIIEITLVSSVSIPQ